MKFFNFLLLIGTTLAQKDTATAPCPDDVVTESDCSRSVTVSGIKFTYYADLQKGRPTLHGHLELAEAAQALTGSEDYPELRICVEFGKAGTEYDWREQI